MQWMLHGEMPYPDMMRPWYPPRQRWLSAPFPDFALTAILYGRLRGSGACIPQYPYRLADSAGVFCRQDMSLDITQARQLA